MSSNEDDDDYDYEPVRKLAGPKKKQIRRESDVVQSALSNLHEDPQLRRKSKHYRRHSEAVLSALAEIQHKHYEMESSVSGTEPSFRFDPTLMGPLNGRSCTDVFFLLIFITFIICWIGIAGFGKVISIL